MRCGACIGHQHVGYAADERAHYVRLVVSGSGVLLQLILPVPSAGQLLSRPLAGNRTRFVMSVFVENLVYVTCISFTMAVLQAEGRPVVDVWLQTYAQLVAIGYVASLVLWLVSNHRTLADHPEVVSE